MMWMILVSKPLSGRSLLQELGLLLGDPSSGLVSKPLSGRSLLQAPRHDSGRVGSACLQTAKRSFTFASKARWERNIKEIPGVSKPLSGRSLLQGLPLKRQSFDDFARLFPIPSANLPLTLDSPRII